MATERFSRSIRPRRPAGASLESVALSLNETAADYDRQAERADKAEARVRELLSGRPPGGDGPAAR